jgi:adenylate cyclase, class 2
VLVTLMGHLNVEFKARCGDLDDVLDRLLGLGARSQGIDEQDDVYYRVPKGRLKLRRGTIENTLIHYLRPDVAALKESDVRLVQVDPGSGLDDLLGAALDRDVTVRKRRHILWLGNVKFHLDRVAGLGSFLEIEAIGGGDERGDDRGGEELRAQCDHYMRLLGVRAADLEARSYSDMLRATAPDVSGS